MIERLFVGRQQPPLISAAQILQARYSLSGVWDLTTVLPVVPGRQAGRRLRQNIEAAAARAGIPLVGLCDPITPAELLERLYRPELPTATPTQARFAWKQAAHRYSMATSVPYLAGLAAEAPALRETVAAERLSFADLAAPGDDPRWQTLAELEQAYRGVLAEAGLSDRDDARMTALTHRGVACGQTVFLIGIQDLNGLERAMLTALPSPVCAVIPALECEQNGFDETGSLRVDFWHDTPLTIPEHCLKFVEGPTEEAHALEAEITAWGGTYAPEQITVGVGDVSGAEALARRLNISGLATVSPFGRPLSRLGPGALLRLVHDYLEASSVRRFAALIRHPDVEEWLTGQSDPDEAQAWAAAAQAMADAPLIHCLDRYRAECLVERFPASDAGTPVTMVDAVRRCVLRARDQMEALVAPLRSGPRPVSDWMGPIAALLRIITGEAAHGEDTTEARQDRRGRVGLANIIHDLQKLPSPLAPMTTAAEALDMVSAEAETIFLPSDPDGPAMAMMGWLDLVFDDAPVLLLTGLHEGSVPAGTGNDPLLPDSVRRQWGLVDDRRRQARDAWLLQVILDTRRQVRIIVTRRGPDGAPKIPSRLLFACDGPTAARRALAFTKPGEALSPTPLFAPGGDRRLSPPFPQTPTVPINSLKVTAFRDYLSCPYRFYLRYVVRLDETGDDADEMDPRAFGNLLHPCLEAFARSSAADSTDPVRISGFLRDALEWQCGQRFGAGSPPSIQFQKRQAGKRLDAFAHWQAQSARDGWQIQNDLAERELEAALDVDGQPFIIRGRLDRVDYHPATDRFRIIDYKTGDSGASPEDKHRAAAEDGTRAWTDLQLPLYRTMLAAQGFSEDAIEVGYVLLATDLTPVSVSSRGRATGGAGFVGVGWREDDYRSAQDCAAEAVRRLRAGVFWPPSAPPRFTDAFSGLCLDACGDRADWFAVQGSDGS